jgi:hypothetical protein
MVMTLEWLLWFCAREKERKRERERERERGVGEL